MSDAFGFQNSKPRSTAEKLAAIRPARPESDHVPLEAIDRVADAHGFASREARVNTTGRRKGSVGPTIALNMRAPEGVALPFIKFCEENRFSYWEGIAELMKRGGVEK